jgi:phosphoenolpyruvate carboxykinase (GTP)
VARLENRTFICSAAQSDAGPTNNWKAPAEMKAALSGLLKGAMAGRTLFCVPFLLGPAGSRMSRVGVQITDSAYVVLNLMTLCRVGRAALDALPPPGAGGAAAPPPWVRATHTVGAPLSIGAPDTPWPSNANKLITHFPESREVVSYGSGYGGNGARRAPRPARPPARPPARLSRPFPRAHPPPPAPSFPPQRCSTKSALRCASRPPWGARRGGSRSTC